MPIYEHKCDACSFEWEDIFKLSDPVPVECPSCKQAGQVKRLMSMCAGRVELTGREHVQKLYAEGKKIKEEAKTNENLLANLVGESKYNENLKR